MLTGRVRPRHHRINTNNISKVELKIFALCSFESVISIIICRITPNMIILI